jgi:hypothetical protein
MPSGTILLCAKRENSTWLQQLMVFGKLGAIKIGCLIWALESVLKIVENKNYNNKDRIKTNRNMPVRRYDLAEWKYL